MLLRRIRVIIIALVLTFLLTNCAYYTDFNDTQDWPAPSEKIDGEFQKSLYDFSWNLFKESIKNEGNVLISPASVYLALGMTYNGSDTETREAFSKTLMAANIPIDNFNEACRNYISVLRTHGEKTELAVANSIWCCNSFEPADEFISTNKDYFGAGIKALDFNQPAAVNTINNWVDKQTKGTIGKIIEEIDRDVVMYLINAVYFKSDWKTPFEANNTVELDFVGEKETVKAKFMRRIGVMGYIEKDGARGVMLPYYDERFSFFALLPAVNKDIREFINELDGDKIFDCLQSMKSREVSLSLPKFEAKFEDNLEEELKTLGLRIAFDPYRADLSLMNKNKAKDLYISKVMHKTYCKVDEKGTEASAATSVEVKRTGAVMEDQYIKLTFDRLFVYGIVDTTTRSPLFIGLMTNPTN